MISKRLLLVALVLLGGLAACGKDDVKPASSGEPATSTTEVTAPEEPAEDAAGTQLTVTGTEYAYQAAEGTDTAAIPAGPVTITIENAGAEEHQVSVVQLREGKTQADVAALAEDISQFDEVLTTWGGPNGVAPGASNSTTQVLEAGEYLFVCFIPAPDGEPHVAKGMVMPVTVEGEAAAPTEPADDLRLALKDYDFGLGDDALLEAGAYTVSNDGPQAHEVAVYAAADGATTQDVLDYFRNPAPAGPPPIVGAGGLGPIDPGRTATMELAAGEYVFVCFIPDAGDGAPHFTKGMIQVVNVE